MNEDSSFYCSINALTIAFQSIQIAKKMINNAVDEKDAVKKFRKYLESDVMWHGTLKFPENESNEAAYKKCISHETAKQYCPVRWKSIMIWADVSCFT